MPPPEQERPAAAATHPHPIARVRLDKWLWAARFFRSRSLARQAIESGRLHYNGERSKVGKEVELGAVLRIPQGAGEIEVRVRARSEVRTAAPLARLLYEETPESRQRREAAALRRDAGDAPMTQGRPSKKQRRAIQRFKRDAGA